LLAAYGEDGATGSFSGKTFVPAAVNLIGRDVDEKSDVRGLLEGLEQDEAA